MKKILLASCLFLIVASNCLYASGSIISDRDFFDAVNLGLPGLEKVKADVDKNDFTSAKHDFVSYLKERRYPKWYFNWKDFGTKKGKKPKYNSTKVEQYSNNEFHTHGIDYKYGERINWTYNPNPRIYEYIFTINRHASWVELGKAYWATGESKYADAFIKQMIGWVEDNPVPEDVANFQGSAWRTIDSGIRMNKSWPDVFFYFLPSPLFDDDSIIKMVKSFYEHGVYLRKYQTRGNWLTMEMNGLFHVAMIFPEFKRSKEWADYASNRLYEQEDIQIYPDGAQTELTTGYHFGAMENIVKTYRIATWNGYKLPDGYKEKLEKAYWYGLNLMTPRFELPAVNDAGWKVINGDMKIACELFPENQNFIWGRTLGKEGLKPSFTSVWMPWAGWYIMRNGWEREDLYAFFDVGPLGTGHQHEDKLSLLLYAYGDRILTECGIYPYDQSPMRKYATGARSHNITKIDGKDQCRRPNKLLPGIGFNTEPMKNRWISTSKYDFGEGWYNEGFGDQMDSTVTQYRALLFLKNRYWFMLDVFNPKDDATHLYESYFHFATPNYEMLKKFNGVQSKEPGKANLAIIRLDGKKSSISVVVGQDQPEVQGWVRSDGPDGRSAVAVPYFKTESSGLEVEPYILVPVRDGESLPVKSIKAKGGNSYDIHFANGNTDHISFELENGSIKSLMVNGKDIIAL